MNNLQKFGVLGIVAIASYFAYDFLLAGPGANSTVVKITVEFEDRNGIMCPSITSPVTSPVMPPRGKVDTWIYFQASENFDGKQYSVVFDPFKKKRYKSDSSGVINRTLKVGAISKKSDVPNLPSEKSYTFKYLIFSDGCETIDPVVVIDR